ncbi:site-specific integrase [soil metagenome]
MAYIDKHPKSPFYRAIFRDADGQRVCRSLKTKDRKIASKMATDLELAAKRSREGHMTTDKARQLVNDILSATGINPIDSESAREFFNRWLAAKERTKATNTGIRYASVVRDFLAALGPAADKALSALQPRHVEVFLALQTDKGRSPSSLRMDIKIVASVFAYAMRQGFVITNPALAVELDEAKSVARECFTKADIESLLAVANQDWLTAILLGSFAGLRLGDAVNLTWQNVELVGSTLTFMPQKTRRKGRTLTIPLHPRLQEHLESLAGDDPLQPLTLSLVGKQTGGATGLSRQFAKLMKLAGIEKESRKTNEKQARSVSSKSFHSLRHTFNSAMLNAGVDESIRMELSGHTTAHVNRKYSHAHLETLRSAVAKI